MPKRIAPEYDAPVAIAPAPAGYSADGDASKTTMPYSCQTCARRKVKCDKVAPACSSCRKSRLDCFYQAPFPRAQKRRVTRDVLQRLARYEHILRQHGLLPHEAHETAITSGKEISRIEDQVASFRWDDNGVPRTGKFVASKYIDSNLWHDLGEEEIAYASTNGEGSGDDEECELQDAEEDESMNLHLSIGDKISDPLCGAFLGSQQSLLQYHPTYENAIIMWKAHAENVEPICKILHIPSTFEMLEKISQNPSSASKNEECLLFAIYHFAVFSMNDSHCFERLGQSRSKLMKEYHFATRQALVNASFLRSTEMSVLQALVLFLLSCRYFYDPSTYWILTGVAIRIGQRIGLHRDGEKLGLPPFEVQMRRRLFFQLLPLEGIASQLSGTGITAVPDHWDTLPPLNINDDQIWPGMTEKPQEQKGATDMIFCMARSTVGSFLAKTSGWLQPAGSHQAQSFEEAERIISEAESAVEEKYIRYCDILNPRVDQIGYYCDATSDPPSQSEEQYRATETERREMFKLSQKILDTDAAAYAHASLGRYLWHVKPFFLWGSWDSLIYTLTSLREAAEWLAPADIDDAWTRVSQVYANHPDLLKPRQSLHVAFRRLTLKAWDANQSSNSKNKEPDFIKSLRSSRKTEVQTRKGSKMPNFKEPSGGSTSTCKSISSLAEGFENTPSDNSLDAIALDAGNGMDVDLSDWVFWDQLLKDYQAHGKQQE
ncbi:unnamed protein product [Clonostachys chloroleuca]|uniref:Zn(2)-C6 fungal-type domain-containing protein n=1 Tax=Clonostachys chloroleuca TaxID=1926264 RepID=A0AA35LQM5_9HYPO|nr:unnamed protein product [Clonostachys chloroleuca]